MSFIRRIWSSLYLKVALVFVCVTSFLSILLGIVAIAGISEERDRFDQSLNRNIAAAVAENVQPHLASVIDQGKVQNFFKHFQKFHPKSQLSVLNDSGEVLISSESELQLVHTHIDVTPIEQFLSLEGDLRKRIIGEDPYAKAERQIFSAATLTVQNSSGYLYILFHKSALQSQWGERVLGMVFGTGVVGFVLAIPATVVFGLVLFFFMTRRFAKLKRVVRAFEKGDYSRRFDARSFDEASQFGRVFNHMADAIQSNIKELEKNDEQRRALVANVSHDLRTPLTTIQGFLEIVLHEHKEDLDSQVVRFLELIHEEVESLGTMVNELFELSKYDAKGFQPRLEAFSPSALAEDLVQKFQPIARDQYVRLEVHTDERTPYVHADFVMVERALCNLLDNALRHTPPNGEVSLAVEYIDGKVEFKVSDSGPGIPAEDIPFVFDRFFRVEKARSRKQGGAGLGLAIVKSILDAHGSEIQLESGSACGSVFRFTLDTYQPDSNTAPQSP